MPSANIGRGKSDLLNPRSEIVHNVHTALVDPDRGLKNSSWGVFGSPRAPVASERAPRAYLVVGGCCVGFKWHFSVKMARWSTGVFWGAREVADVFEICSGDLGSQVYAYSCAASLTVSISTVKTTKTDLIARELSVSNLNLI